MDSRKTILLARSAALALVLLLAAVRVEAAEKRFSVSPFATALSNGASHQPLDGLQLWGSDPYFAFNLLLPRDYVTNTDVRIRLYWDYVGALFIPCDFVLEARTRYRARPGQHYYFEQAGVNMKPARRVLHADLIEPVNVAPFDLKPPPSLGQKPSDSITVAFQRKTSGGEDSCSGNASLVIVGIEIIYTSSEP